MKMRLWAAAAAAALILCGRSMSAEILDRVMAVVGSEVVTLSDVRAAEAFGLVPAVALPPEADTLAGLVNRQLMLTEVERYSAPEPDATVVERRVAQVRARFASEADYRAALARSAMSDERLRGMVSDNLRIEAYVDQRFAAPAQPTPDEVLRYYKDHASEFTTSGKLAPFEEVQRQAEQKAAAERRRALLADWLDRLRRRPIK